MPPDGGRVTLEELHKLDIFGTNWICPKTFAQLKDRTWHTI